jgi:transglutaminase-like putative cysteine protease
MKLWSPRMLIKIGYDLTFDVPAPLPMNLMLYVHPSRMNDLARPEQVNVDPWTGMLTHHDSFGNTVARLIAPPGKVRIWGENVIRDSGLPDPIPEYAVQHPIPELPADVLQFLLPSRYCEADRMHDIAWELFGHLPPGWGRVKAVIDWVHKHVTFGYPHARNTRTAVDTYYEKVGVCRDFQHLCCALHRCLNVPARYVAGYLGDIGVPFNPAPMDFSAWHQVYLGGRWWDVDGRHNVPRIGRVLMAVGRDAADVALTTQFGAGTLTSFKVVTEQVQGLSAQLGVAV